MWEALSKRRLAVSAQWVSPFVDGLPRSKMSKLQERARFSVCRAPAPPSLVTHKFFAITLPQRP